MILLRTLLSLIVLSTYSAGHAVEVWNEGTDGELSYDFSAPTDVGTLQQGLWEVTGSIDLQSGPYLETFDHIKFTTEGPWTLDVAALSLAGVTTMGVSAGWSDYGPGTHGIEFVDMVQTDVFTGVLPAGTYTLRMWINGNSGVSDYSVQINIGQVDVIVSATGGHLDIDDPSYLYPNEEQSFTVLVTNNMAFELRDLVVYVGDSIDAFAGDIFLDTVIVDSAPECTPTELSLVCDVDLIEVGQTRDLSFKLRYNQTGVFALHRTWVLGRLSFGIADAWPPTNIAAFVYNNVLTDSDADGVGDFNENLEGTDPGDPASTPGIATIDLLALYPSGLVAQENGGHLTRINHLVARTNEAFVDSGVGAEIQIVGYEEVVRSVPYDTPLEAFDGMRNRTGEFSSLGQARDDYAADLLAMFIDDPVTRDVCGWAQVGANSSQGNVGFRNRLAGRLDSVHSVTVSSCASWVATHEIGHNMGLTHSRDEPLRGAFDFAVGHVTPLDIGTIMASGAPANTLKFSSPLLDCFGDPCGVDRSDLVNGADAVLTLNATRYQIAALKSLDTDGDGVPDHEDAFPNDPNEWLDTDGDGIGNNADLDDDNDGMPDVWEEQYFLDPLSAGDAGIDSDGDRRTNLQEYLHGTNPLDNTSFLAFVTGDHNGDGKSDILWRNSVTGQNWMYLMNGNAITSSQGVNTITDADWKIVGGGDYNGDGFSDLLWRHSTTGENWMYLMNGDAITSSVPVNTISDTQWQVVGNGDFNGDGKSDILWRHEIDGRNWMYLMSGTSIASSLSVNTISDTQWKIVGSGDYNGDGQSDILWRHSTTGQNWMYLMNGNGIASSAPVNTISDTQWNIVGSGDYNGDGNADILWRHSGSGQNWMYLMNGNAIASSVAVNNVPTVWDMVGNGDYNGDGNADILWRHNGTGQNWMYLMNGSTIDSSIGVNTVPSQDWQVVNPN